MNKISQSFLSSISKSIKKECILKAKAIPSDETISYLLKLLSLSSPIALSDQNDMKKHADLLINSAVDFIIFPSPSLVTVEIQILFAKRHSSRDDVLVERCRIMMQSTDALLQHILGKQITKTKEDSDQLYHSISCYIVLLSGAGDPTDDEVLKETTVALKSILSSKEIIRFASKSSLVKEKQLADVCNIVTGIRIYNKDSAKKSECDNELFSDLQKAFQKCNHFLDFKLREIEERSWRIIRICLHYHASFSDDYDENFQQIINELKAHLILLQQISIYFRTLNQDCHILHEELQTCCLILEQRLVRVRKTVKCRTAIPVVEIYPQFKDIALSWDKIQELTALLNHLSEIVFDIWEIFEKVSKPNIENLPFELKHDVSIQSNKDAICIEDTKCELVTAKAAENFYNILVEYAEFCVVAFVEAKGVVVPGIKEYGLIKYRDKYYCFSTTTNANKFAQDPDRYIKEIQKLVFKWPESICLLKMEKHFEDDEPKKDKEECRSLPTVVNAEVQTEIHPIPSFKDYTYTSSLWQLQQRIVRLAELKKRRTHSVQTNESNFRKNSSTQTDKRKLYK